VPTAPADGQIKKAVIEGLHRDPHTKDEDIKIDVKQKVIILGCILSIRQRVARAAGH